MEIVIGLIIISALWIMRKTIRVWSNVAEKTSESTARKVMLNTAKQDIKTSKKVQAFLEDTEVTLELSQVDNFLFEGKKPKGVTNEN